VRSDSDLTFRRLCRKSHIKTHEQNTKLGYAEKN